LIIFIFSLTVYEFYFINISAD